MQHNPGLTFFALCLATAGLIAQTPDGAKFGEIRLQVKDPRGLPLAIHGVLYGPTANRSQQVDSASDGSLVVSGLAKGRYTLVLIHSGFAIQRVQLSVEANRPVVRQNVSMMLPVVNTTVSVTSSTPIGSLEVPISDVPVPVQTLTSVELLATNAIDLTDAMKRRLNGVYVTENQNNPFQPDLNYRGYTASPLVGSPAGMSVYLDGVRQNQPFGDVVQWDLIPKVAISTTELIPGSNPLYGLNTLGGAIAVRTKDGLSDIGLAISGYGGSFGRRAVDAQYGANAGKWNWFTAGTLFHEDGWRVLSPSSVKQSFAKVGYAHKATVLSLSGGYAINLLIGNGTQDFRALNRITGLNHGYNSVYSIPDATYQHQPFLTFNVTQAVGKVLTISGNAYVRSTRTNTTNGDVNDDSFDQSLYSLSTPEQNALTKAGIAFPTTPITPVNTPFPYLRCVGQALLLDEPGEKCTGVVTDTVNRQHALGVSGVLGWRTTHNQFSIGAAWDRGGLTFQQQGQYGYLNTDGLSITRVPAFLNGATQVDGKPQDSRVDLHGTTNTKGLFFTDTFSKKRFVLTAGARYNHTTIDNMDRLPPVSYRGTLTATDTYGRFNPTAGFVYKPLRRLGVYLNYGESSRAPTSTELGCSDPNFPCSLPNALVSDPPLKQVVSHTYEFGLRGSADGRWGWTTGYFHTDNSDDLLFVAAQATGYGFFQNFGKTRREGLEASVMVNLRKVDAGLEYTFLQATYQTPQTLVSPANSSNSVARAGLMGVSGSGTIDIVAGNHIPQIPQNLFKVYVDYRALRKLKVSADLQAIGSSYVRGNENNLHQPDGRYYLGSGKSPGFCVVNLGSRYSVSSHYELFLEINNMLNRRYYTAGQLAVTPYDDSGNFSPRPFASYAGGDYPIRNSTFLAPGTPITVFGGVKVSFGVR